MVAFLALFTLLAALADTTAAKPSLRKRAVKIPLTHYSKDGEQIVQLYTQGAGIEKLDGYKYNQNYAMQFEIGTPPQTVTMLVDTGSTDIVLFGQGCQTCGDKVFNWPASSTYKNTGKNLTLYYGTGSAQGIIATDTTSIGGFTQATTTFVNVQSGPLKQYLADGEMGIIGMSWPWPYGTGTSWAQTAASTEWPEQRFGVYLGQPASVSSGGPSVNANAGELVLGGVDEARYAGRPLTQYPLVNANPQRWNIDLSGLRIDGVPITLPGGSRATLIDTGAENNMVPLSVCQAVAAKIPGSTISGSQMYFPCNTTAAIEFQFGNIWYPTAVRDIFYLPELVHPSPGMCTSMFLCNPNSGDFTYQMGAAFLRNVYSVYSYNPKYVAMAPLSEKRGNWEYGWGGSPSSTSVPPTTTSTTSAPPTTSSTSVPPTSPSTSVPPTTSKPTTSSTSVPPTSPSTSVPPTTSKPTTSSTSVPPTSPSTSVPPTTSKPTTSSTSVPPTSPSTSVPPTTSKPTTSSTSVPPTSPSTSVPPTTSSTSVPPTSPSTSVPPTSPSTSVPPTTSSPSVPPTTSSPSVPPTTSSPSTPPTTSSPSVPPTTRTTHTVSPKPPTATITKPAPSSTTSCNIPKPTASCPCRPGSKQWWWDGKHWRFSKRRNYRPHGWRWGPQGFAAYKEGTDEVEAF